MNKKELLEKIFLLFPGGFGLMNEDDVFEIAADFILSNYISKKEIANKIMALQIKVHEAELNLRDGYDMLLNGIISLEKELEQDMKYKLLKEYLHHNVGDMLYPFQKEDPGLKGEYRTCYSFEEHCPELLTCYYEESYLKSLPNWFAPVEERGAAEIIKKKSPFEVIKSHVAPIAKYSDEWTEGALKALYLNGYEIVEKNIPAPDDDDDGIPPVIRTEKRTPITLNITSVRQGEPLLPDPEEDEILKQKLAKILKEEWVVRNLSKLLVVQDENKFVEDFMKIAVKPPHFNRGI